MAQQSPVDENAAVQHAVRGARTQLTERLYDRAPHQYTDVRAYRDCDAIKARLHDIARALCTDPRADRRLLKTERLLLLHKLVLYEHSVALETKARRSGGPARAMCSALTTLRRSEAMEGERAKRVHTLMLLQLGGLHRVDV